MPTPILMPALSPTMEEGKLAKWLVNEGDSVAAGDVIAEIETDKATMEVEAVEEGRLGRILVQEGTDNVQVNTPIAVILDDGEDAGDIKLDDFQVPPAKAASPATPPAVAPASVPASATVSARAAGATVEVDDRPADPEIPPGTAMLSLTVREALRDAMAEEMRADDDVFVMGEEVAEYQGAYKVTQGLLDEFGPRRVIDTPITEHGFAGVGIGAAFAGLKPIVEFMTWNFAMQAMDQLINSAAKTLYMSGGQMGCPIVFRGPNGAAARVAAQHSQDFAAWYAHVPGLKLIAPYSAADAKGLLKAAIRDPNPVFVLENEILYGRSFEVPDMADWVLPIGRARILKPGRDVTLVSYSRGLDYCLEAEQILLQQHNISAEVIDLRSLRPLDMATILASVRKTHRLVTVEESWPVCSIGSEICATVALQAFDDLDAPPTKVSGEDVPMPYAANLEKLALPDAAKVVDAVLRVCYK